MAPFDHGYHNGTTPYDRGFQSSFSIFVELTLQFRVCDPGRGVTSIHNNTAVSRPDNTTYSADLYVNTLIDQIKASIHVSFLPGRT